MHAVRASRLVALLDTARFAFSLQVWMTVTGFYQGTYLIWTKPLSHFTVWAFMYLYVSWKRPFWSLNTWLLRWSNFHANLALSLKECVFCTFKSFSLQMCFWNYFLKLSKLRNFFFLFLCNFSPLHLEFPLFVFQIFLLFRIYDKYLCDP